MDQRKLMDNANTITDMAKVIINKQSNGSNHQTTHLCCLSHA